MLSAYETFALRNWYTSPPRPSEPLTAPLAIEANQNVPLLSPRARSREECLSGQSMTDDYY